MSEGFLYYSNFYSRGISMFILPEILKLNIAEKLQESPKSIEDLTHGTSINPDRLHRFLQHLESSGIFSFNRDLRKWTNTRESAYLTSSSVKPWLQLHLTPYYFDNFLHYGSLLYSNEDIFELRGLASAFEELAKVPSLLSLFQEGMKATTKTNINEVVEAINLDNCTSVLEVGGGRVLASVFGQ